MAWTTFGSLPSGNVSISLLDDNFDIVAGQSAQPIGSVSGSANAITGTTNPVLVLAASQAFNLVPAADNTGPATLALNGGSAKSIFAGGAALSGAELKTGVPYLLIYDGAQFNLTQTSASAVRFLQPGTGAMARTAQAKLRDVVSVKDFGAVGDGVTDDTAEIQATITYAATIGCSVYFPAATYLCSSQLTLSSPHVSLVGNGWGSKLDLRGNPGIALSGSIEASPIRNLQLYSGGTTITLLQAIGVNDGLRFEDVLFTGGDIGLHLYSGIAANGSYGVVGRGCVMNGQNTCIKINPQTVGYSQAHFISGFEFFGYQTAISCSGANAVFISQVRLERTASRAGASSHVHVDTCNKFALRDFYLEESANTITQAIEIGTSVNSVSIKDGYWTLSGVPALVCPADLVSVFFEDNFLSVGGLVTTLVDFNAAAYIRCKGNTVSSAGTVTNGFNGTQDNATQEIGPNKFIGTVTNHYSGGLVERVLSTGTFTLAAAGSTTVNDGRVTASSVVTVFPANAAAATLMSGSKSLYLNTRVVGVSFTVTTADGTSAAGTENFTYMIFD